MTDPTKLPALATAAVMAALGVGALLLFHFTQVFPRRRPWIRSSGIQMAVAYLLAPLTIAILVRFAPASVDKLTTSYILVFLVFGFPLLVLLGFVLPVAAIVSLLRSHREVQQSGPVQLKRPIEWILVSQVAGGTLAIVFAPVLAVVAPNSVLQSALTIAIWAFGLLTPAAYAAAIWKYHALEISADDAIAPSAPTAS
jgi:MFS family permease